MEIYKIIFEFRYDNESVTTDEMELSKEKLDNIIDNLTSSALVSYMFTCNGKINILKKDILDKCRIIVHGI